jgi:hypothetical protein
LAKAISSPLNFTTGALSTVKDIVSTSGSVLGAFGQAKDRLFGVEGIDDLGQVGIANAFIAGPGPFTGENIFGDIFKAGLPNVEGIFSGMGQLSSIGQIPGFGLANQAIGTVNMVNNIYKSVMGSDITAVTEISSLVTDFGGAISSEIASIASNIGSVFGFRGF